MATISNSSIGDEAALNEVTIRRWELNANSTFYDRLVAAPSDDERLIMWSIWSAMAFCSGFLSLCAFLPVVLTKKTREQPFNLYMIAIYIPDIILGFGVFCTQFMNALNGSYTSEWACHAQSFYIVFSSGADIWLNGIVTYELYKMLSSAKRFERYKPPSRRAVVVQALMVYGYCATVASFALWREAIPWWPIKTRLVVGLSCIPMFFDNNSTIFFFIAYLPMYCLIPFLYVLFTIWRTWKYKILPHEGKGRMLWLYFLRIIVVFIVMWTPSLLFYVLFGAELDPWVQWAGGLWALAQGSVSAIVSLLKPDIIKAVKDFWTCRQLFCCVLEEESTSNNYSNDHVIGSNDTGPLTDDVTPQTIKNESV